MRSRRKSAGNRLQGACHGRGAFAVRLRTVEALMALRPGSVFAGYVIERRLGIGGMGAVYAARHPRLPRRVALKILSEELGADPAFRARFEREAELAARVDHPNVVSVYDRGAEGDRLWIAMQYVDGV